MKNSKINRIEQLELEKKCSICHRRPIELYQDNFEGCYQCWQALSIVHLVDQVDDPEV